MPGFEISPSTRALRAGGGSVVVNADGSVSVTPATGTGLTLGVAPPATTHYALMQIGNAPIDGLAAGHYTGSASGGGYGANFASGYTGELANWQVAGVSKFKVDAKGNVSIDVSTSTTASPNTVGFTNLVAGTAVQLLFGDTYNVMQCGSNLNTQISSFWGLELYGGRQGGAPAFRKLSTVGVQMTNSLAATTALVVQGAASQTADLQQWTDSATHPQFGVANVGTGAAPIWALRVRAVANAESMAQLHTAGANTGRAIQFVDDAGVSLGWLNLTS